MNDRSIDKPASIQPRRHGFQPGKSGNPAGKPRGTKSRNTQLVERLVTGNPADVKAIIDVTVREAKAGEPWAAQEILKRIWPVPRGRLLKFPLPPLETVSDVSAAIGAVTQACANGLLTVDEASALADILERHAAILKADAIERRLRALEDAETKRLAS
jgi:hypothetical protein